MIRKGLPAGFALMGGCRFSEKIMLTKDLERCNDCDLKRRSDAATLSAGWLFVVMDAGTSGPLPAE